MEINTVVGMAAGANSKLAEIAQQLPGGKITISNIVPTSASAGDVWIDTSYVASGEETILGYYKMNELLGTTVADASDNAYHATSVGTTIVDGFMASMGKAQQGNGAGYVLLPAGCTLAGIANFKVEFYFRKDAATGDGANTQLVNQYIDSNGDARGVAIAINSSNILTATLRTSPSGYKSLTGATVVLDTWYKVEVEYTGIVLSMSVYSVDGSGNLTLIGYSSGMTSGSLNASLKPITLLASNSATHDEKTYCTIDDVKITYKAE